MKTEAQREHHWLLQLVGDWTYESEAVMEPGEPPKKWQGTESVRAIGELWVQLEGRGPMPDGGAAVMQMTLGYDPQKQHYIGTWIGSMMTHLWVYRGTLDEAGKVLTLESEGPDFAGTGKLATYHDIIEIVADDHRVLRSEVRQEDGTWQHFMTAHYRRVG